MPDAKSYVEESAIRLATASLHFSVMPNLKIVASQTPLPRRFGSGLKRGRAEDAREVSDLKVRLACEIGSAESVRDFGGLWGVHGRYLLESAICLGSRLASMVDVRPYEEFAAEAAQARAKQPNLEVAFTQADFRKNETFRGMEGVEVSLLYDVLLHQENYLEVIGNVCDATTRYICFAQPCLQERLFLLPDSATLLQFWPEELKTELRKNSFWPAQPPADEFAANQWIWGHTSSHIVAVFHGFGWDLAYGEVIDQGYGSGDYWEYSLLRFAKRS